MGFIKSQVKKEKGIIKRFKKMLFSGRDIANKLEITFNIIYTFNYSVNSFNNFLIDYSIIQLIETTNCYSRFLYLGILNFMKSTN